MRGLPTKNIVIAYTLWATGGVFGWHRMYTQRRTSGWILAGVSLAQALLMMVTFARSFGELWILWPPYGAFVNLRMMMDMLGGTAGTTSTGVEDALVTPLAWVITLPSLIIT